MAQRPWQHKWNRQRVIEALQAYGRLGHVRCNLEIPNPVRMAALYLFGNWHNALVAAELASPESKPAAKKRWTDAALMTEIRRQSVPGLPMQVPQNRRLATVAIARFGSWHRALRAAGVEPVPWRIWSPQRVLQEIHAWHQRSAVVESNRPEYKRLLTAARARFGGWRSALVAAGILGPKEYLKCGRQWTRDRIIETIQDRHVRGLSLKVTDDFKLSRAAARWFDSWHTALTAAGIPVARKKHRTRRKWTRGKVIEEIRMRQTEGFAIIKLHRIDGGLVTAARQYFGGWHRALAAAGFEAKVRRQWSRQNIITAIRAHHRQGTVWQIWKVDLPLFNAGQKYFGSWKNAVRAAGLTPRCLPWSKERILRELRARYRRSQYNLRVVDSHLSDAMRRVFGSRLLAYEAAGLPPKNCQWPKDRIVKTIEDYYRRGMSIERAGFGDVPLRRAAKRQFGSWQAAVEAAGIKLGENRQ